MDLFYLLFAGRKLGFDVLPLEGDFEHLPQVPRPCIVPLEGMVDRQPEFAVIYEIGPAHVIIGNTATGTVESMEHEAFRTRWGGDIIQIRPDPEALKAARQQVDELHDPLSRLKRILGLRPLSLGCLSFVPTSAVILLWAVARQSPALIAIGLCAIFSLWSWIYSDACSSCSQVKRAVGGLRIAEIGASYYCALFLVGVLAPLAEVPWQIGVFAATGVHLALLGILAQSKSICLPCVAAAISAFMASIFSIASSGRAFPGWPMAAIPGGVLFALLVIVPASKLFPSRLRDSAYKVAAKVLAENVVIAPGHVRMVVYVRQNCPACSFYKTVLRQSLEGDFGEAVSIEERDAGRENVATPLYVISGSIDILAGELPTESAYDRLQAAIETAMSPEGSKLKAAGGFYVIGFGV
jgi:hypothetical protein